MPNKVPNFYPAATDPTLIYMVLRDPPGGASYTTIKAGTTIDFGMSIDGMHTFDSDFLRESFNQYGFDANVQLSVAPFGFGLTTGSLKMHDYLKIDNTFSGTTTAKRLSSSHYKYSLTFDYEFSTSKDPFIAGHPSDMIVGGGVDMIVSEAIGVGINKTSNCLYQYFTQMWMPGRMTTYILPVIEIEELITTLRARADELVTNINDVNMADKNK
jgi:hypothetical protein